MSLQLAANHLASQGRGPDTQLIHMSPREVAGLQALAMAHGGSLTVNPKTGLPEAGILDKLLPTLIGVGVTAATGGAAAPWMIGLGVGGIEAARTGSLGKGLLAGLGAYGGAGMAGGLMGLGATSPELAAQALGTAAATGPGSQAAMLAAQNAGFGTAGLDALASSAAVAPGAAPVASSSLGTLGRGLMSAMQKPEKFVEEVGGNKEALKLLGAAAAPGLEGLMQPPTITSRPSDVNPYRYAFEVDRPEAPYTGSSREAMQVRGRYVPYAEGGPVEAMSQQNAMETLASNGGQMYAKGGVSHLGDYSDGGRLLRGPGDGVSDSIPATIADKRPARLADGEFVVPARIVSELGNGSTEAGARKLYAMMDRVQKARSKTMGKDKVATNTRTDRMLPA